MYNHLEPAPGMLRCVRSRASPLSLSCICVVHMQCGGGCRLRRVANPGVTKSSAHSTAQGYPGGVGTPRDRPHALIQLSQLSSAASRAWLVPCLSARLVGPLRPLQ